MNSLSSTGHGIVGSGIPLAIVSSIAVVLRLSAKRATKARFAADDRWIIFALVTFWVYLGVELGGNVLSFEKVLDFESNLPLTGIYVGAGGVNMDNFRTSNLSGMQIFFKSIRVNTPLFAMTITGVKLSILSLYYRIFSFRRFRLATLALGGVCAVWLLALVLCSVFACFEPSSSHCIDYSTFYLILSLVETLIEVTILCLPIRMIAGLQLPVRDKIVVLITFLVGGFVCITGIVRLAVTYRPGGQFDVMKCMLWSNIQLGAAIPGACLLTYRPLLSKPTCLLTRLFCFPSSSSTQPSSLVTHKHPNNLSWDAHENQSQSLHSSKPRNFFGGRAKHPTQDAAVDMGGSSTGTRTMDGEGENEWPLDDFGAKIPAEIV
ncbi:hypothetical protein MMC22_006104 [Lobaria immixta]|nr:hypothetical protein [Lobaria immixta]